MVRIKTPVRFQSCRHLQCVDALALLRMNELSYGWRCPICNASSSYHKLHVDQYFADVLASPLLPSTCSQIELQENGSWKPCYDPKVQDLDYRFNMSLNDSVVEITNLKAWKLLLLIIKNEN
ncbi:hypothetical protein B566_EDAN010445 [Ephemera danica]|nr:hypothetical protein B566_EDAN010445 [Ephemera danica]